MESTRKKYGSSTNRHKVSRQPTPEKEQQSQFPSLGGRVTDQIQGQSEFSNLQKMLNPTLKHVQPKQNKRFTGGNNGQLEPVTKQRMPNFKVDPSLQANNSGEDLLAEIKKIERSPQKEAHLGSKAQDLNSTLQTTGGGERGTGQVQKSSPANSKSSKFQYGDEDQFAKSRVQKNMMPSYNQHDEAFDLAQMKDYIGDDDAGGAIMKKLYRIHSRYKIELDEDFEIDEEKTNFLLPSIGEKSKNKGKHARVKSMIENKQANSDLQQEIQAPTEVNHTQRLMDVNSNIFQIFATKNQVDDYEELLAREAFRFEQQNYEQKCELVRACFQERGKRVKKQRVIHTSMTKLMKYHTFFFKMSTPSVQQILLDQNIVKIQQDQLLYKQNDTQLSCFMLLFGKVVLHDRELGTLGMLAMGDFVGEDILFPAKADKDLNKAPIYLGQNKDPKNRQETAYCESDAYLIEFQLSDWLKIKKLLYGMKRQTDYIFLEKHVISCYSQKKQWRKIKARKTGAD